MSDERRALRVGVIGANAASWAMRSHLPALKLIPRLELTAVATSQEASARDAARVTGARQCFVGHRPLVESKDVDVVIVAVKVPHHRELVTAALDAGKHVYCEWPLGVDVSETRTLAAAAEAAGVHHAVGLQARSSPALRYARDLIADGYVGTVESVSMTAHSSRGAFPVSRAKRYLFDAATGANLLTIEAGHLLDAAAFLFGELHEVSCLTRTNRSALKTTAGSDLPVDTADTLSAQFLTATGGLVTAHVAQGTNAFSTTELQISGSRGALRLRTQGPGGIQMADLLLDGATTLTGALSPIALPARYTTVHGATDAASRNVGEALSAFARGILDDKRAVPDFAHALVRHESLARLWTMEAPPVRPGSQEFS